MIMRKNIVAHIDLLGFKEAIRNKDRKQDIFLLLEHLENQANTHKKPSVLSDKKTNGIIEIKIKPKMKVISDSVILSLPVVQIPEHCRLSNIIRAIASYIQALAMAAIKYGFLIRGGIAYGDLYVDSNVLFGPAHVEAYELEQEADMPRVIASTELLDHCLNDG